MRLRGRCVAYEIVAPGGANEHWNAEPGELWLRRAVGTWPDHVWPNPVPQAHRRHTPSLGTIGQTFPDPMMPLTLDGLTRAMRILG